MSGPVAVRVGPVSWRSRPRTYAVGAAVWLLALAAGLGVLGSGSTPLTAAEVWGALTGSESASVVFLVRELRLPRALTGVVVGASLAVAGSLFQALTRNSLGSPDIIGLTSGAATGAVVGIVVVGSFGWGTAVAATAGCLATVLVTWALVPRGAGGGDRLVLVGLGAAAFLQPVVTLLLTRTDADTAAAARAWLSGTLNARDWSHVWVGGVVLLASLPVAWWAARLLDAAAPGEDLAVGLGVPRTVMAWGGSLAGGVLTAGAVAVAGPIAFVALAGPHLTRRLLRGGTVPVGTAAGAGAALLLAADLVGANLPAGMKAPVGVTAGLLGGLYLVALLYRQEKA